MLGQSLPLLLRKAYNMILFGVGGSGRSPLNPPTPRYEGAGVRVDLETKRKFIVVYREVVKYIV